MLAWLLLRLAICCAKEPQPPNPCVAETPSTAAPLSMLPVELAQEAVRAIDGQAVKSAKQPRFLTTTYPLPQCKHAQSQLR